MRLEALERLVTGVVFRARIGPRGLPIPLKIPRPVEINAGAESEAGILAVLPPQTVRVPGVDVSVGVDSRDKHPVVVVHQLSDGVRLAIFGDESVGDVGHGRRADPFSRVSAAGDEDRFSRAGMVRMHANSKCGDLASLVRSTDIDHSDVRREHGSHETHPLSDDGKRLVIAEEDITFRRWFDRRKRSIEPSWLIGGIRCVDQLGEVVDDRRMGRSK